MVQDELDARFQDGLRSQPHGSLRRGLIGSTVDSAGVFVVVVDAGVVDVPVLQRDLRAVADGLQPDGTSEFRVRVQGGCHPSADLYEVSRFLANEFRLVSRTGFSFGMTVESSIWMSVTTTRPRTGCYTSDSAISW